jgi:hypothetical protein
MDIFAPPAAKIPISGLGGLETVACRSSGIVVLFQVGEGCRFLAHRRTFEDEISPDFFRNDVSGMADPRRSRRFLPFFIQTLGESAPCPP